MKWHAIYSTPSGEFRATLGIDAALIEAFCPVERLHRGWARQKTASLRNARIGDRLPSVNSRVSPQLEIIIKPLFSRYLFARFDSGRDLGRVLKIDGVADVLRINGKLGYVDERMVDALRCAKENGVFDRTSNRLALEDGAEVEIKDPKYAGLVARVKASRSKDRIRIILDNGMVMSVPANKVAKTG